MCLGFLRHIQHCALYYDKYPFMIEEYSDAIWISGSNELKSISGYVFILGGKVVSWKLSKQTCISLSTMQYEVIVLDKASEEAEWLWNFLEGISFWPKPMGPICIHCDSQTVISREGSVMYNEKSYNIRQIHNPVRKLL